MLFHEVYRQNTNCLRAKLVKDKQTHFSSFSSSIAIALKTWNFCPLTIVECWPDFSTETRMKISKMIRNK